MRGVSKPEDLMKLEREKDALRRSANYLIVMMGRAEDISQVDLLTKQLQKLYDRLETVTASIVDSLDHERQFMLSVAKQVRVHKSLELQPAAMREAAG